MYGPPHRPPIRPPSPNSVKEAADYCAAVLRALPTVLQREVALAATIAMLIESGDLDGLGNIIHQVTIAVNHYTARH